MTTRKRHALQLIAILSGALALFGCSEDPPTPQGTELANNDGKADEAGFGAALTDANPSAYFFLRCDEDNGCDVNLTMQVVSPTSCDFFPGSTGCGLGSGAPYAADAFTYDVRANGETGARVEGTTQVRSDDGIQFETWSYANTHAASYETITIVLTKAPGAPDMQLQVWADWYASYVDDDGGSYDMDGGVYVDSGSFQEYDGAIYSDSGPSFYDGAIYSDAGPASLYDSGWQFADAGPAACPDFSHCDHVMISEVATGGPAGAGDEFVELYNPTNEAIDLTELRLEYRSATGTGYRERPLPERIITWIQPHAFLLLTSSTYMDRDGVHQDMAGWTTGLAASGGHVRILVDGVELDRFGWGNAIDAEGAMPMPALSNDRLGSYERIARNGASAHDMSVGVDAFTGNAFDTDSNGTDFIQRYEAQPQDTLADAEVY